MPDFKAIAQRVTEQVFAIASSVTRSCSFKRVAPGTYDPSTGTDPATVMTTPVTVIFGPLSQKEVDGQLVKVGDKRAVIKRSQLATEPKRDDYLLDGSVRFDIVAIPIVEPTESVWVLIVREVKE